MDRCPPHSSSSDRARAVRSDYSTRRFHRAFPRQHVSSHHHQIRAGQQPGSGADRTNAERRREAEACGIWLDIFKRGLKVVVHSKAGCTPEALLTQATLRSSTESLPLPGRLRASPPKHERSGAGTVTVRSTTGEPPYRADDPGGAYDGLRTIRGTGWAGATNPASVPAESRPFPEATPLGTPGNQ